MTLMATLQTLRPAMTLSREVSKVTIALPDFFSLTTYAAINPLKEPSTMQLSFLGQSYEASIPTIETTETAETATFLGRRYARKQFNVSHRQQPATELTYRGVRYTH